MEKIYLVVGAAPHEERRGRTFYDYPSVFLLDNRATDYYYIGEDTKAVDFLRYIVADFKNLDAMNKLSETYPSHFDVILFDTDVVKFFNGDLSSLPLFWNMLKPGGQLIMDTNVYTALPWQTFWNGHPKAPYPANFNARLSEQIPDIMTKMRIYVSRELSKLPNSSIESTTYSVLLDRGDPILKDVYSIANPKAHIFVVRKVPESVELGGGYRKRRYRRKTSRKTKRKHRH